MHSYQMSSKCRHSKKCSKKMQIKYSQINFSWKFKRQNTYVEREVIKPLP